jgi:hypothetical protein
MRSLLMAGSGFLYTAPQSATGSLLSYKQLLQYFLLLTTVNQDIDDIESFDYIFGFNYLSRVEATIRLYNASKRRRLEA